MKPQYVHQIAKHSKLYEHFKPKQYKNNVNVIFNHE